ncbi:hypothetical protein BD770DRAFT_397187 [Pilaira anomala]|nr:hypothetical protein BD770DRAFT_397187 [Pilaira anomala]
MDARMKRYFRAWSILDYEQDQGSLADTEFETSMVGHSCWIPSEKKRFFLALERCGKNNIKEIAQRVGPTKTLAEVMEYLKLLQYTSKGIGNLPVIRHLTAREMSPIYIVQEQIMAEQLQEKLEIESFGKHLDYLNHPQLELLEIFNMSLLTRIFSGKPDMTVFSSTAINFHQLIKKLVSDILLDLHTELSHTKDKIVTKDLIQLVLTKRQRGIEPDRRLKQVQVPGKFRRFKYYNNYSRVPKRKRSSLDEGGEDELTQKQRADDDTENDYYTVSYVSDSEEEVSELLNIGNLRPPPNNIVPKINHILRNQHVVEDISQEFLEATNSIIEESIELGSSDHQEDTSDEEKEELEMQKADAEHEAELIQYFEFYDEKTYTLMLL